MANGKPDIRWRVGTASHPKIIRLVADCGERAFRALAALWEWVGVNRPDGNLRGMDVVDIAIAAGWHDAPPAFCEALFRYRLIEGDPGEIKIHDWSEEQPWVANAPVRSAAAKHAASMRWASKGNANRMRPAQKRNAPLLSVSVSSPDPEEKEHTRAGEAPDARGGVEVHKPKRSPAEQAARDLAKALGSGLPPCRKQILALKEAGWDLERIRAALPYAEPGMAPWDWTKLARTGGQIQPRFPDHTPNPPSSNGALLQQITEEQARAAADIEAFKASGLKSRAEWIEHKRRVVL